MTTGTLPTCETVADPPGQALLGLADGLEDDAVLLEHYADLAEAADPRGTDAELRGHRGELAEVARRFREQAAILREAIRHPGRPGPRELVALLGEIARRYGVLSWKLNDLADCLEAVDPDTVGSAPHRSRVGLGAMARRCRERRGEVAHLSGGVDLADPGDLALGEPRSGPHPQAASPGWRPPCEALGPEDEARDRGLDAVLELLAGRHRSTC